MCKCYMLLLFPLLSDFAVVRGRCFTMANIAVTNNILHSENFTRAWMVSFSLTGSDASFTFLLTLLCTKANRR